MTPRIASSSGPHPAWVVCSLALIACEAATDPDPTGLVDVGADAAAVVGNAGADAAIARTCGDTPVRLVDYIDDIPDAGRSAVQVPTIGVSGDDLFYALNWHTPLGATEGPGGYLMRVSLMGGDPVRVAVIAGGGSAGGQGLAVTPTAAIFSEARQGEGAIVSVPAAGGAPTTLASTAGLASAVVADEGNVYFVDDEGTKRVSRAGGDVRTLTSRRPDSMMVDGATLYLAEYEPGGGVFSVPVEGGPVTQLATHAHGMIHPVRCAENVCWMTGPLLGSTLEQIDPEGHVTVLATGLTQPHGLVFDGQRFFVSTGRGSLQRIPAAGGEPVAIHGDSLLSSLAVDDTCLYWSSASGIHAWALSAAAAAAGL
jgi:hypothetical protein